MAVQILSDLHLEAPKAYDTFEIVPKAPHLALLGDIGNVAAHKDDFLGFLTRQLRQFQAVLFVPGNHEAYHSNWPETLGILRAFQEDVRKDGSLGEFVLLDRTAFRLPSSNVVILGCSLFSHVPPESRGGVSLGLNDFYQTSGWDVDTHNDAHKRDLEWLNTQVAELEDSDVKIVILTHWTPTRDPRSIEPRHFRSPVASAFSTDLSGEKCFKSDRVKVWAFGHTHYNCDFTVEREDGAGLLRLVANQRGYYFAQSEGFDGEKTIEL
ncbi:Metallo-dependent phosphatase-like protein [Chaetomium strumarium]|uniref:Metallo-dependent phosphatase-like protein n=1 Tax=Chaetomium strumarium TaxID=1170767 RepID=A0AAJ0GZ94_9PEZI|nr:Metallo-dependent phosphatase-like protein [Chaetomium strumarium]